MLAVDSVFSIFFIRFLAYIFNISRLVKSKWFLKLFLNNLSFSLSALVLGFYGLFLQPLVVQWSLLPHFLEPEEPVSHISWFQVVIRFHVMDVPALSLPKGADEDTSTQSMQVDVSVVGSSKDESIALNVFLFDNLHCVDDSLVCDNEVLLEEPVFSAFLIVEVY